MCFLSLLITNKFGLGGSHSNLTTQILNKELHSHSVSNGLYELSCIEATELARPRWSGRWNRASRVARKHIFTTSKPGILRLLYIELFMTLKSSCNLPSESDFSILYKCIHSDRSKSGPPPNLSDLPLRPHKILFLT